MADILLSSGLQAADMHWAHRCRAEDMTHRKIENQRRLIDNARRKVDKKAAQLKAISHLSALIAGFSMVVLVEAQIEDTVPMLLLAAFGLSAATVIGLMLMAMINCTLILVIILKHDCSTPTGSTMTPTQLFLDFWDARCEEDWQSSFKMFRMGVPAFLVNLALLGWVKFFNSPLSAILVTVIVVIVLGGWIMHTRPKWGATNASTQRTAVRRRKRRAASAASDRGPPGRSGAAPRGAGRGLGAGGHDIEDIEVGDEGSMYDTDDPENAV